MSSDWKKFEEFLNMFDRVFTKMGIWPSRKVQPIRYPIMSIFIIFCILIPIKIFRNLERESIENAVVNGLGCFMAALFMIRLTLSEKSFISVFDFIREDLRKNSGHVTKQKILSESISDIQNIIKFVVYILPLAIFPKFLAPFLEYGYAVLVKNSNSTSLILPPPMAFPQMPFLYYDSLIIYILECSVQTIMLCWLMAAAFIFVISSLYIGGQFRVLAVELGDVSVDDVEIFDGYLRRHGEIIR